MKVQSLKLIILFMPCISFAQLDHFRFSAISNPQTVGIPFTVTVFAESANGNRYDTTGTWTLAAFPTPQSMTPATISIMGGVGTVNVILRRAVYGDSAYLYISGFQGRNNSNVFRVNPGSPYRLFSILPGEVWTPGFPPGRTGSPATQAVNSPFNLRILLTDTLWNRVPSGDVVHFASSDPFAILPPDQALVNGDRTVSVTLRSLGQQRFYTNDVSNPGIRADTSSIVNVIAALQPRYLAQVTPDSVVSGAPFKLFVAYVSERGDTLRTSGDITVTLQAQGGSGTLSPTSMIVRQGYDSLVTITYRVSGGTREIISIRISDSFNATGTSNTIIVIPIEGQKLVNFPNPFGTDYPTTTIAYVLPGDATVSLRIYDLFGNPVKTWQFSEGQNGGRGGAQGNTVVWDGKNDKGYPVGAGAYICRLIATRQTEKVLDRFTKIAVVR